MTNVGITIRASYRRDVTFYVGIVNIPSLQHETAKESTDIVDVMEEMLYFIQHHKIADPEYRILCEKSGAGKEDLDRRVRELLANPFVKKRAHDRLKEAPYGCCRC